MSLTPAQWMEIGFNVTYLAVIYGFVAAMSARLVTAADPLGVLHRLRAAFFLLALGDTGHVGFRVIALLRGGLESRVELGGHAIGLVGAGALATAVTVTVFYLLLLEVWRLRFGARTLGWSLLQAVGALRLVLLLAPQNDWGSVVPPLEWSLIRNAPLLVLGLGVAGLFLRDASRAGARGAPGDARTFTWFAVLILASYAFYAPVILFVQRAPWVGVLMVPKTVMYLLLAWLAWTRLFKAAPREADTSLPGPHLPLKT